jgi:hypothetical protein
MRCQAEKKIETWKQEQKPEKVSALSFIAENTQKCDN